MGSSWQAAPALRDLWIQIERACPESPALLQETLEQLGALCPDTAAELRGFAERSRRDAYLLRFVLPVAELAGWPSSPPPELARVLTLQLLWAMVWRRLDDVMDLVHGSPSGHDLRVGELVRSLIRALRVHGLLYPLEADRAERVAELTLETCSAARQERFTPIPYDAIWRRAGPFLIVPETALKLAPEKLAVYRELINLQGLVHDIHDFFDDLRNGTFTLPGSWLDAVEPARIARPDVLQRWFARASEELALAIEACRAAIGSRELRASRVLLVEACEVQAELEAGGSRDVP